MKISALDLKRKYMGYLRDPHTNVETFLSLNQIDFLLRKLMGKTQNEKSRKGYASHHNIIKRQRNISKDDMVCRVCLKNLEKTGEGRYNDHLVIRAKDCTQPICIECAKHNPDEYHKKFQEASKALDKIYEKLGEIEEVENEKD